MSAAAQPSWFGSWPGIWLIGHLSGVGGVTGCAIAPELPAATASGARAPGSVIARRDYHPDILERLAFIRHAQAAGLTLDAIRGVLDIRDQGQPPCIHVTELIAQRLAEVEARLAELARTRDQLAALAARAVAQDPADCHGYCSIIAS
ncbi:MAG: MerR family DNA-binding protein [Streptosporangiaceae bacterium]